MGTIDYSHRDNQAHFGIGIFFSPELHKLANQVDKQKEAQIDYYKVCSLLISASLHKYKVIND